MSDHADSRGPNRRTFVKGLGVGVLAGVLGGAGGDRAWGGRATKAATSVLPKTSTSGRAAAYTLTSKRVAADPTKLPAAIGRRGPRRVEVTLEVQEVVAEIEPGVAFSYLTFGGQVPGPMIRVRQGDTVRLTLSKPKTSASAHNVDLHAVYGTGGSSTATLVMPGQSASVEFKAMYPGAFIYHCAVPMLDYHIASGMFGMIVVEPPGGLEPVDRELYMGQHEVYLQGDWGEHGLRQFDFAAMQAETPTYVLLNGEKDALTPSRWGAVPVRQSERVRIFFVCGGPNLTSHFHAIGNVWTNAWANGALANAPQHYVQTLAVAPGDCAVVEFDTPVPETIKLVDHALTRVVWKGMLGMIDVRGEPRLDIFNPRPTTP